jgi:hypothetical protein
MYYLRSIFYELHSYCRLLLYRLKTGDAAKES